MAHFKKKDYLYVGKLNKTSTSDLTIHNGSTKDMMARQRDMIVAV